MRPAGPSRGVLDPATYHTSKSIANAMRGGGAGSGPSVPATLLVLIALAVALPALSFFAMHARVLDHQQTLTENYAVRHEATTIRSARASTASSDGALFGRRVLDAQPFSPTRFPNSSPHPCFLCFLSDDDGGTDDCEKGSERDARDWFGSAGRTRGARPREAGAAGCRGAREGKGVLRRRNDAESPQGRRRGVGSRKRLFSSSESAARISVVLRQAPPLQAFSYLLSSRSRRIHQCLLMMMGQSGNFAFQYFTP